MKNKLQNLLIDSLKLSIYPIFTQMGNTKFPQNPTQEQLYELIRAATKQGMKDCENEKELLKKAATKAMLDSSLMDKLEQHHKEHEDLIITIEFVLDHWYLNDKNQEHRNVLKKFLERLKNYN